MRTLLLFLCLPAFSPSLYAQVFAGNPVGLAANTPAETVNISVFTTSFGKFTEPKEDSLDFDRNGQFDVIFSTFCCNTFDCVGGANSLSSIHSNLEWVVDSALNLQKLSEGQRVDSVYTWRPADYTTIVYKISGIGGYMEFGNWRPNPTGFAGFRLTSPGDTIYGWVKIQANASNGGSASIKVMEWAIQSALTEAPTLEAGPIQVFPNPFFEHFTVKNDCTSPVIVQLMDVHGRVQLQETPVSARASFTFDMAQLPPGVYFLQEIQAEGRQLWVKKLVKR